MESAMFRQRSHLDDPRRCKEQTLSPFGRFFRRRSHVLARTFGLTTFLSLKPGLSLMWTASNGRRRSLNRKDIECSSRPGKNPGARL
jgi:hypothetical protein